jgi:uncharacterized protein YukE
MAQVGVNFLHMEEHQLALLKVVTAMDEITDRLYTDVKKTLGASWEGEVSNMFDTHRLMWDKTEKEMGALLHAAAEAVGVANENYKQAERANMRIWGA